MMPRSYTVAEIDQMRAALFRAFPNEHFVGTPANAHHSQWVEERLRTYLLASIEPDALLAHLRETHQSRLGGDNVG